jgi:hypothetical protein
MQGNGYATEAAAACRDFARDVVSAAHLVAIIHPDNAASQHVAKKIGLQFEENPPRARSRSKCDDGRAVANFGNPSLSPLAIKSMWDENSCQPWFGSGSGSKLIWLPGASIVRGRPYFDIAR